jgi:hypothetical protein
VPSAIRVVSRIHRREQFASEASFRKTLTAIRNALVGDSIVQLGARVSPMQLPSELLEDALAEF